MNGNSCSSCSNWIQDPVDPSNIGAPRPGECRCNPPQLLGIPTQNGIQLMVIYPKVPGNFNACAQYAPHEEFKVHTRPLTILGDEV